MTKKNTVQLLVATLVVLVGVLGASAAEAAGLNWSADSTITVGATNYTVSSGSAATSLITGTATITVNVPSGSTFTLVSSDKYALNNDQVISQQCTASTNTLSITGPVTAVVTPDITSVCVVPSAPSGGGGGGGGGGPITPVTTTTTTTTTATTATPAVTTPTTAEPTTAEPTTTATEPTVTAEPTTTTTTTTTPTVTATVPTLADVLAIVVPPLPASPTVADYQATLAALMQKLTLLVQIRDAQAAPAAPAAPVATTTAFTTTLTVGSENAEVRALQELLKAEGSEVYPAGIVSGYFGSLTKAAVGRFQLKYGIVSSASHPAYGLVGPATRAKLNSLR